MLTNIEVDKLNIKLDKDNLKIKIDSDNIRKSSKNFNLEEINIETRNELVDETTEIPFEGNISKLEHKQEKTNISIPTTTTFINSNPLFEAGDFVATIKGVEKQEETNKFDPEESGSLFCPYLESRNFNFGNTRNYTNNSGAAESGGTGTAQELFVPKGFNRRSYQYQDQQMDRNRYGRYGSGGSRYRHDKDYQPQLQRHDTADKASTSSNNDNTKREKPYQDLKKASSNEYGLFNVNTGKRTEQQIYNILSEDMRISKILRRLNGENNPSQAIDLCKKLESAVTDQANQAYIRKAFDFLAESCIEIFKIGPPECLNHVAKCFGILGYVARNDFPIYKNWLFKNYDNYRGIRCYLMRSLKVTFYLDVKSLDLITFSERVLIQLKSYLENTDNADEFVAISDCIGQFAINYKKSFEKHFTDIVDIIVGWHLEPEQTEKLKKHCCNVLQNFSDFFIRKLEFTLGLLEQFLEDIQSFGEEINNTDKGKSDMNIEPFFGVLNSVLKCLTTEKELIAFKMGQQLFNNAVHIISKVGLSNLKNSFYLENVQSLNEFFSLVIHYGQILIKYDIECILEIIKIQQENIEKLSEAEICSLLWLILVIIKKLNTSMPIEIIPICLNPGTSKFVRFKLIRSSSKIYRLYLKIYHDILLIKNVPLLQESYKYILLDIIGTKKFLFGEKIDIELCASSQQAECILNFNLSAISILATQSSSIIAMYALQPSILELILKDLEASSLKLWTKIPSLHSSILNLLLVHCMKNHNYLLSSNLISSANAFSKLSLDETSPTSENFMLILKFHLEFLQQSIFYDVNKNCFISMLKWLNAIFEQSSKHSDVLNNNKIFNEIAIYLCKVTVESHQPENVVLQAAVCLETLLSTHPDLLHKVYLAISQTAKHYINSTNQKLRDKYTELLSKLPLKIALNQSQPTLIVNQISELQQWYISIATTNPSCSFREKYFKDFIEKLSNQKSAEFIDTFMRDCFTKCWEVTMDQKPTSWEFYKRTVENLKLLIIWIELETAQYCVANKLKTSLGKPQDTFLKIESILKENARILALKDQSNCITVKALIANQKHAKILLGFLEFLEKIIYNASEGAAFALQPPEKPARAFFRVNTSTCNEWFNRNRTAVNLVGLHCGESEMVIRYCESMLQNLVNQKNDPLFEHTLMSYVWALLNNGESETLLGLYQWIKNHTGKRFGWIKCAAEQASCNREKAAEGYQTILKSMHGESNNFDKYFRDFIYDQLIDCLYSTEQLVELKEYLNEPRETVPLLALNYAQIDGLMHFASTPTPSVLNLCEWETFGENEELSNNFSYHKLFSKTENTLVHLLLEKPNNSEEKLNLCKDIIKSGLEQCLRTNSKIHYNDLLILNHICQNFQSNEMINLDLDKSNGSLIFRKCKQWGDYFKAAGKENVIKNYDELHLNLISMSRKENNLKLCKFELERFYKHRKNKMFDSNLMDFVKNVQENVDSIDIDSEIEVKALCETSKWLFTQLDHQENGIQLAASCCVHIILKEQNGHIYDPNIIDRCSRMILRLSDWVQQCSALAVSPTHANSSIHRLISIIPDITEYCDQNAKTIVPVNDMVVGKLIQYSVKQSPKLAKSWSALGNWYYRWGRKVVEAKTDFNAGLLAKDITAIKNLLPNCNEEDLRQIVQILNQNQVIVDDEENVGGQNEQSLSDIIEQQLRTIESLQMIPTEIVSSIIEIWRQAHKFIYSYYEMAADSYFKFLNLIVESDQNDLTSENYGDCAIVTATLRLLRLVVKHAFGLQDVLEEGLTSTPTRPWKAIIPQLFSRLNHHEVYVRKRVSELLCRVAKDSPHLIIFPAVVGAAQNIEGEEESSPLVLCFNSLLSTLSKQTPETVQQVQILLKELKRISLLWDEFWLHSLAQLYSEYSELFNSFESEVRKCTSEDKISLMREKYKILIGHIVDDLERYYNHTSRTAETNYEKAFQDKYSKLIESSIQELKEKSLNLEKPNESWQKIKQLYSVFQQKFQRNFQTSLKMSDISPILSQLQDTVISMPGVETIDNKPIYIRKVDNTVYVLPTKTKPKKLAFYGSDGRKYTYLFKGLEDLHLDERIMQFLSISNSMMSKSNDTAVYKAHHYSVIPLGTQSGLISWVDGMTPLFSLYKKWQQREASNPVPANKKDKPSTPMRPSELFYKKLTPLLGELNMKPTDSRKAWPLSVLRKVLEELTSDTPKDLLAKELWCHSPHACAWRQSTLQYSRSVAVMSVIGYVIGLGDRHLDNVLVKLSTGNIVHIDYNVCFEKGKTLRVPERVPFRMTPNLQFALGLTGIEGTFRLTCEHVLKTLRKEREILLTLLEAFVYDPLVDWAVSDDGTSTGIISGNGTRTKALIAAVDMTALGSGVSSPSVVSIDAGIACTGTEHKKQFRRKLENEVMRNTLTTRFAEIKPEWTQYRDDLNEQLLLISNSINDLESLRLKIQDAEKNRNILSKQFAMIRELESLSTAMGSHPLNTISQRYATYKKSLDDLNNVKKIIQNKYEEYFDHNVGFFEMINNQFMSIIDNHKNFDANNILVENEFIMCKEFLENSDQSQLYRRAEFARTELNNAVKQQIASSKIGSESFHQYVNVIRFYPKSQLQRHRFVYYTEWYKQLLESPPQCNNMLQVFGEQINIDSAVNANAVPYAFELEKIWLDIQFNLHKNYELLQAETFNIEMLQEIKDQIMIYLQSEPCSSPMQSIKISIYCELNDIIKQFIGFEENCMKSIKDPYQFKPNSTWIIDEQQLCYQEIQQVLEITNGFSNPEIYKIIKLLEELNIVLVQFKELELILRFEIVSDIMELCMKEESKILEIFENIVGLQNAFDFEQILKQLQSRNDCRRELNLLNSAMLKIKFDVQAEYPEISKIFEIIDEKFEQCSKNVGKLIASITEMSEENNFKTFEHHTSFSSLKNMLNLSPEIINQYFEFKKHQTLIQLLMISTKFAFSLKGSDLECIYDVNVFIQVVSNLINEFQSNFILGLGSMLLMKIDIDLFEEIYSNPLPLNMQANELCRTAIDKSIAENMFSFPSFQKAEGLIKNFIIEVKKFNFVQNLKLNISNQNQCLSHMQLISTVHFWLNETALISQPPFRHILYKNVILKNLQNSSQNLHACQQSIDKFQSEIQEVTKDLFQRLKWAVGANPALQGLQETFEMCSKRNLNIYNDCSNSSIKILKCYNLIIIYELLKVNAQESDKEFLLLVQQLSSCWEQQLLVNSMISEIELGIVQLLDPESSVDHQWINSISDLINEITDGVQNNLASLEKDIYVVQENLQSGAHKLRSLLDSELRIDVRYLLKLIFKLDGGHQMQRQKQFQLNYKLFLSRISELNMKILSKDFTQDNLKDMKQLIFDLQSELSEIYEELLNLITDQQEDNNYVAKLDKNESSPQSRKRNQIAQKRNAYAVSVWRRIRMKLEGRDPDPNRRQNIPEQVDWMIREATNPDNLAVLYEGWTPWV